jgi:hypothetical protein
MSSGRREELRAFVSTSCSMALFRLRIGDELLQLVVLLLDLVQPAHLGRHHAAVALPPVVNLASQPQPRSPAPGEQPS